MLDLLGSLLGVTSLFEILYRTLGNPTYTGQLVVGPCIFWPDLARRISVRSDPVATVDGCAYERDYIERSGPQELTGCKV